MNLNLIRLYDNGDDTVGMMFFKNHFGKSVYIWTLEDEYRDKKVYAETRIPAGTYKIGIRTVGKTYIKYLNHRYSEISSFTAKYGMLEILNVPGFNDVLIHIGNKDSDTAACILTGDKACNNSFGDGLIENSTDAYIKLITEVAYYLQQGEELSITIHDIDKLFGGLS